MLTFAEFLIESDITDRVDPQHFDLKALYRQLNHQVFQGKLADYPVQWGKTPKRVAGMTNAKLTYKPGMPRWMGTINPASISITISTYPYSLEVLKGILAHEMVHAETFQEGRYERDAHGSAFMARLGRAQQHASFKIPLTHTMDEDERNSQPAKAVRFLVGARSTGKPFVSFYSRTLPDTIHSKLIGNVADFVKVNRFVWLSYGEGMSTLANVYPVQRSYKGMGGYPVDLKDVHPTKVYASAGVVPPAFQ